MFYKSKDLTPLEQKSISGIHHISKGDIEFFGIKKTKTVKFIQNGEIKDFKKLPPWAFTLLSNQYYNDKAAQLYLKTKATCHIEQVELYTYYCYGDLDSQPDITNKKLNPPENFRDVIDCPSLNFNSKYINIGQAIINFRELAIIDMIAKDYKDLRIAEALNITESTLNKHKKNLFKKVGVFTKVGLLRLSMKSGIIN